jgi:hypothetical protein
MLWAAGRACATPQSYSHVAVPTCMLCRNAGASLLVDHQHDLHMLWAAPHCKYPRHGASLGTGNISDKKQQRFMCRSSTVAVPTCMLHRDAGVPVLVDGAHAVGINRSHSSMLQSHLSLVAVPTCVLVQGCRRAGAWQ